MSFLDSVLTPAPGSGLMRLMSNADKKARLAARLADLAAHINPSKADRLSKLSTMAARGATEGERNSARLRIREIVAG